ncbi:50S ribosomal protein L24 [Patescibacteria group bacterium]|nr:50S ribosomal protein L24 [Patescibacteria group bacterium]
MKIKKGDNVLVITGKNRGKTGKVVTVDPAKSTVKIAGVNIMKRHLKARRNQPGGITEIISPLPASKVMFVCSHCGNKPVRLGYKLSATNTKERICKVCKSTV